MDNIPQFLGDTLELVDPHSGNQRINASGKHITSGKRTDEKEHGKEYVTQKCAFTEAKSLIDTTDASFVRPPGTHRQNHDYPK